MENRPLILAQLSSEKGDHSQAEEVAAKHNATLVKVSAINGTNVEELFIACAEALLKRETSAAAPTTEAAPAKTETKTEKGVWAKVLAKLLKTEKPAGEEKVQETPVEPADVAPVA